MENKILLNDLLNLKDLNNVKIKFNKENKDNDDFDPIKHFKEDMDRLLEGQFWIGKTKRFKLGNISLGFAKLGNDKWLLFHIGRITKVLDVNFKKGFEYDTLDEFKKYFGRLIVKFHNNSQNMVRNAEGLIQNLEVVEILPETFNDDDFPGYENINLEWSDLKRVSEKKDWKTALENQKGVYLISDIKTGKFYVGSAYGTNMILGRWRSYIKTGHGGNKELIKLVYDKGFEYVKKNFKYSILDIYKSTTDDKIIIQRESFWKRVLLTREFGYNSN